MLQFEQVSKYFPPHVKAVHEIDLLRAGTISWEKLPVIDQHGTLLGFVQLKGNHDELMPISSFITPKSSFEQALKTMFVNGEHIIPVLGERYNLIGFFDFNRAYEMIRRTCEATTNISKENNRKRCQG